MEPRSNDFIFICGENSSREDDYTVLTKGILIAKLATNWAVRTHCDANGADPRSNNDTLFRNIAASRVFLFIFSEETIMNAFYLNQLGIAYARRIPIVGIREPSYIMPNPLPEHYYSTEIVDFNERPPNRPNRRSRSKAILSNLLVESFRSAVVYASDFHRHCIERLFRKVTDAYAKCEKEKHYPSSLTISNHSRLSVKAEPTVRQKLWNCVSGFSKCPKCGSSVKSNRKSSILRKTNSVEHLYKEDAAKVTGQQQIHETPQLVITKSVIQPMSGPYFSKEIFNAGPRRPATSVVRKSVSAKADGRGSGRQETRDSRPTSTKSCNAAPSLSSRTKIRERGGNELDSDEHRNEHFDLKSVKENVISGKTAAVGLVTNKRGAFLRKMSSLPCIPTTYLVAEPGSEEPALVKYPLVSDTLTVGEPNVPEFTDDEDRETIHISRRPSPAISTCSTNIE